MSKTTKETIEKQLEVSLAENERQRKLVYEALNERDAAIQREKKARTQFADLKERLSNAEQSEARLRGYLERVHEDDIVRDGMVEIEDEQGKRMVPKRPKPMMPPVMDVSFDRYSLTGDGKKRTHWTSY